MSSEDSNSKEKPKDGISIVNERIAKRATKVPTGAKASIPGIQTVSVGDNSSDVVATKQSTGKKAVVPGAVHEVKERRSKRVPESGSTDVVATKQPTGDKAVVPGAVHATKERRSKRVPVSETSNTGSEPSEEAIVPGAVATTKERRSKRVSSSASSQEVNISKAKERDEEIELEPEAEGVEANIAISAPIITAVAASEFEIPKDKEISNRYNLDPVLEMPNDVGTYDKGGVGLENEDLIEAIAIDSDEEEGAVVAEIVDVNQRKEFQKKCTLIAVVIVLLIGAGATAAALLITKEETTQDTTSEAPSASPTSSSLPTNKIYLEEILLSTGTSDGKVLDDTSSPQYKAMFWLSEEDALRVTPDSSNFLQRFALAVLYYSTNGDEWTKCSKNADDCEEEPYLSDKHECEWHGSTCTDGNALDQLIIVTNNMEGTMPDEIGLLQSLTRLSLNVNTLRGTLPSNIGSLSKLTTFTMTDNSMTGSLPEELFDVTALSTLQLGRNLFNGKISSNISKLINLTGLYLFENFLEGNLNAISTLSKLRKSSTD